MSLQIFSVQIIWTSNMPCKNLGNNTYLDELKCENTEINICTLDNFEKKRVMLYEVCCSSNNRCYIIWLQYYAV
jgi:hypothetical protein